MKYPILALLFVFSILSVNAAPLVNEVLTQLTWGHGANSVALTKVPAHKLGPPSLASDAQNVYLLDAANQRIVSVGLKNKQFSSIPLNAKGATDFCLDSQGRFHVLYAETEQLATRQGNAWQTQSLSNITTPISVECGTNVWIGGFDGQFYNLRNGDTQAFPPLGDYHINVLEQSPKQWRLSLSHAQQQRELLIRQNKYPIQGFSPLGVDRKGRLYVLVFEDNNDTSVRFLQQYSAEGKLLASSETLLSPFAYILKEFSVLPDGGLMQLVAQKSGMTLMRWYQGSTARSAGPQHEEALRRLQQELDQEDSEGLPSEAELPPTSRATPRSAKPVTRQAVMDLAKKYANYRFSVDWPNITSGEKLGGKVVITPLQRPGTYKGVPYKWGGDDSLAVFSQGLNAGKKAGDKCTSSRRGACPGYGYGSSAVVGVDCSGFVSKVWQSGRYSTSTLPRISKKIRWNALKPGDILNKRGHVMLFNRQDMRGKVYVYEATGSGGVWKVLANTHTKSRLQKQGYRPYRYRHIIDTPITVQPPPPPEPDGYPVDPPPPQIPTGLYISGNTRIPAGQANYYTAKVRYPDGTTRDVTAQTQWSEDSPYAHFRGAALHTESNLREPSVTTKILATYQAAGKTLQAGLHVEIQGKPQTSMPSHEPSGHVPTLPQPIVHSSATQRIRQLSAGYNSSVRLDMWLDRQGKRRFYTSDKPIFYYRINSQSRGVSRSGTFYVTVFNITPNGNWLLWLDNEAIQAGKTYQWPRSKNDWGINENSRINKQFSLDRGIEYLKGVITSSPVNWKAQFRTSRMAMPNRLDILGDAELSLQVD